MSDEPRHQDEYSPRQTEAARRVLVDLGQVLGAFQDCLVVVGGWVPDLLLTGAEEPHVGSIDVDLALDAKKLSDGRYAELVGSLLKTRRYHQTKEPFRLYTEVDLGDRVAPVRVDVDFLKSPETRTKKNRPTLTKDFRPLDAAGCATAFENPELVVVTGQMVKGRKNQVQFRVASIANFLVMKSYALSKRDKPKDAYDICYCVENYPGGIEAIAVIWKARRKEKHIATAMTILAEKFAAVDAFGPGQVVEFYNSANPEEREIQARRAYELVQTFLSQIS